MKLKGELFKGREFYYYSPEIQSKTQKYGSSTIRRMFRIMKIMLIKSKLNEIH